MANSTTKTVTIRLELINNVTNKLNSMANAFQKQIKLNSELVKAGISAKVSDNGQIRSLNGRFISMKKVAQQLNDYRIKTQKQLELDKEKLKSQNKQEASYFKALRSFRMFSISMMVAGYAIQRTFQNIANVAISSFQQIISTNGFMKTNINALSASWEFLKFTIGSALNTALGPLMPMILNIINKISDWIQQHPKLTSGIVLLGFVLGALLGIFGLVGYAISGLGAGIETLTLAFKGMGYVVGLLSSPFLLIAALVILLILLIPKARNAFFDVFKDIWLIVKNVVLLIGDILTGDFESAIIRMKIILWGLAKLFVDVFRTIWYLVTGIISSLIEQFGNMIKVFAKGIDMLMKAIGKKTNYAGAIDDLTKVATEAISNIGSGFLDGITGTIDSKIKDLQNILDVSETTAGTTSETQIGPFPDLTSTGLYGQNTQTVGSSNTNININNNFSGVGKDTSAMINESINKSFQQAYQTAKQYQT